MQLLDLSRRILRQLLNLILLAFQTLAQRFLQTRHLIFGQGLRLARLRVRLALLGLLALLRRLRLILPALRGRLRARADFVQPIIQRVPLQIENLVQLALDVVEDRRQVEPLQLLTPLLAQTLKQIAQTIRPISVGRANAALHHVAQRLLQVAERKQIVRQRLQHIVRVQRRDILRAVPLRVSESGGHGSDPYPLLSEWRVGLQSRRGRRCCCRPRPC